MPSYVLAAQEIAPTTKTNVIKTDSTSITVHHYNSNKNQAISPQRSNLSLNLSPQYFDVQQSDYQQEKQQLGQRVKRSHKQLKAPTIKSTVLAANTKTDVKTKTTTTTATTSKMLANVSNNLVGAIGSDDAYSERALLLRGAENVAGSGAMQHLLHTNNTTTTTATTYNNNQNSFNLRTMPKTTTIKTTHNNNNYGSTLIARNNVVDGGGGGDKGDESIDDVDYFQTADDDMLSDVACTTNAEAVTVNDNDEQKNNQLQTRQTVTTTIANANKKTKMNKLGAKNVGLKR